MKAKKFLIVGILAVAIIFSVFYAVRSRAVGMPFGGFVTSAFFCSCDGGWLLTIGPPLGGFLIYRNTPQFPFSQLPRPGVWALGLYEPGGVCSFIDGAGCGAFGVTGTITPIVGTSL